jgi:hypothetical protein
MGKIENENARLRDEVQKLTEKIERISASAPWIAEAAVEFEGLRRRFSKGYRKPE